MFIPKKYGESRQDACMFCDKQALTENSQGLPTCIDHKQNTINDAKCACGEYLDVKKSKWGAFFLCSNCGAISIKKYLELKSITSDTVNSTNAQTNLGYKLNKKYRKKEIKYSDRIYTIQELVKLWDNG